MSIKRFGIAFAATVSGIALLASGVQLNEYWNAYSRARAAYNEEVLLTSGFGTAGGLTVERGPVNRALLGPGPASPDVLKEFDNNKGDTDAALSSLEHLARESDPAIVQQVTSVRSRIENARRQAAIYWQKPKADRPDQLASQIMGEYDTSISTLNQILQNGIKLTMTLSQGAGNLLDVAQKGWQIRQTASINSLLISSLVAAHRPATPEERDLMNDSTGRVNEVWKEILDRGDDAHAPAMTRQGVATARDEFFGANQALRDRLIKAAFDGSPYNVSLDDWRKSAVEANASLMDIRDGALQDARRVAEQDKASSMQGMIYAGLAILFVLALVVGSTVMFIRRLISPIARLSGVMSTLAAGDDVEVPYGDRKDEIGHMAQSLAVFKENSQRILRLNEERKEAEAREAQQRRGVLMNMADELEADIRHVASAVGAAAERMQDTARSMTNIAAETSEKASTVATASEEMNANVQSVAAATEEMSASIQEINRQIADSANVSGTAVQQAGGAIKQVRGLTDAAKKIGEVVQLISDIASKTNLLALNATIESARAGDAGKGFAVVASEVKSLARQTAGATADISHQISEMQRAAEDTATIISNVAETIERINVIATSIAAAMRQQSVSTLEIARSTNQAAGNTAEVGRTIAGVGSAAHDSQRASETVAAMASDVRNEAGTLGQKVDAFLERLRAA